jgi:hypothetical protein
VLTRIDREGLRPFVALDECSIDTNLEAIHGGFDLELRVLKPCFELGSALFRHFLVVGSRQGSATAGHFPEEPVCCRQQAHLFIAIGELELSANSRIQFETTIEFGASLRCAILIQKSECFVEEPSRFNDRACGWCCGGRACPRCCGCD